MGRTFLILVAFLIPAVLALAVTIEAIRTGRFILGAPSAADDIPVGFYGDSILPEPILDNAGWIIAVCILWIVVAALLVGRAALRRSRETVAR